ncbi:nuclear hormone receptor FTZ-F1 beta-like isoform X2 [Limulus polyphemus]|uniref:Nuclear hormone receptor FTZ-F1 beta-like isoform X2 n=1 Tax=Limulus polyphemus TaxID=6850 RepID=A0ABM1BUP5_LIMPO|nr:nuclear hormone receptor FTZ-F1 beta-like isoform X2 [Limulus polyphemus]
MTMDRVSVCQVPSSPSKSQGDTVVHPNQQILIEDEATAGTEVMHVIAEDVGPINLQSKRQSVGLNGTFVYCEQVQECPMSWEGGISDDEMSQEPDSSSIIHVPGNYLAYDRQPPPPPGSPICTVDENYHPGITCKTASMETDAELVKTNNSNASSPTSTSGDRRIHQTPSLLFGKDHPSLGSPYVRNQLSAPTHNSPVQTRHVIEFAAGPYSQSPSPVFPRPSSSSSSISSHSPGQSPLLNRHVGGFTCASYPSSQSPILSRQPVGVSSDNFGSSQRNRKQQCKLDTSFHSPSQSPSHGNHHYPDGSASFSSSPNSAQGRGGMLSRPIPFGASPSPTFVHHSQQGVDCPTNSTYNGCGPFTYPSSEQTSPIAHHSSFEIRSPVSRASVASSASDESNTSDFAGPFHRLSVENVSDESRVPLMTDISRCPLGSPGATGSVSRQQLLSGPCPICGDRISGFHYGIFSCESCKGFFKRTVQNKKNYVCLRGANCHVAINTRKKCPACRFNKCLKMGMKLEAIREDRTRGGRSTYQCTYSIPSQSINDPWNRTGAENGMRPSYASPLCDGSERHYQNRERDSHSTSPASQFPPCVPQLIRDVMSVEHLWHYSEKEMTKISEQLDEKPVDGDTDFLATLCKIADNRLCKIVKWCKSLPLFKEMQRDDQIALLINSWCEMLLLSCCYRSMSTPNEILISRGRPVTLQQAQETGLSPVIERMMNLTEHLRRLQVDQHEFVCLKVIILLTSDVSGLKEPDKVRTCQKQMLEALQAYTRSHYPHLPSKFGELLLRIPELERACQVGKEPLVGKQRGGDVPSFHLLLELLRGDH